MHSAYVSFGLSHYKSCAERDWQMVDVYVYHFATEQERKAFLLGIREATGWRDVYVLNNNEYNEWASVSIKMHGSANPLVVQ